MLKTGRNRKRKAAIPPNDARMEAGSRRDAGLNLITALPSYQANVKFITTS